MTRATDAVFAVYRIATRGLEPFAEPFLKRRLAQGKEDPERWPEKLGVARSPRPEGPLAWVHAASVGEALSVLPLVDGLGRRGFAVLLTTGTVTSSRVLSERLPPGAIHQFAPLDLPSAVERFLAGWRPDLACFTESELWPNLLRGLQRRRIPAVLVNARLSVRSHARWSRARPVIGALLATFELILAQTSDDAERLRSLGASRVTVTGNVKFDGPPPPVDAGELARLQTLIGARPVWVAASTHEGEEALCLAVHRELLHALPDLLTIIVPRHVQRGVALIDGLDAGGLAIERRSTGAAPTPDTAVYLADTMGELGLFYRLAACVFVGKSLVANGGGQNPIEPAKLGLPVLHGPNVGNFTEVYRVLDESGGALAVADAASLATALRRLLGSAEERHEWGEKAVAAVQTLTGATDRTLEALEPLCRSILGKAA